MYPKAYIDYLVLFNGSRDYFECHEVLEDYWKLDAIGERKNYWVGLIQIAVTMYHYRRENNVGALKMIKKAQRHLKPFRKELLELGLDDKELFNCLNEVEQRIQSGLPYHSINLPIKDLGLIEHCIMLCERENIVWGKPSDMSESLLIDKHLHRTRKRRRKEG